MLVRMWRRMNLYCWWECKLATTMEITVENPQRAKKERPYDNSDTTPGPAIKGFSTLLQRHVHTLAVYLIARKCN